MTARPLLDAVGALRSLREVERQRQRLGYELRRANQAAGLFIRRFREGKGITLRQYAKKLGISAAYLCDVECGRRNAAPVLRRVLHPRKGATK